MPDEGFFLLMLGKREAVDTATWQCYSQLCNKLGYYNGTVQVTVDGKKVPLTDAVMAATPDPSIPAGREALQIFRSAYIKAFEDGSLLVQLIKDIGQVLGEKPDDIDAKLKAFAAKSHSGLRTVYWHVDKKFISKLPPTHQVSFGVDCLMFGSFQCNSRNVIGMHLVALACMLDVKQFVTFLPPDLAKHAAVTNPPLKGFLEKKAIVLAINFKDVKTPATGPMGAGAGVAKSVDKAAAKDAKDDKKGAKDDKKGAKDDKKGAKDDKKGAKDDKKGAKDDKKGAKDDKKGAKDDKKGAKDDKKGAKDDKKGAKDDKKGAKDAKKK